MLLNSFSWAITSNEQKSWKHSEVNEDADGTKFIIGTDADGNEYKMIWNPSTKSFVATETIPNSNGPDYTRYYQISYEATLHS